MGRGGRGYSTEVGYSGSQNVLVSCVSQLILVTSCHPWPSLTSFGSSLDAEASCRALDPNDPMTSGRSLDLQVGASSSRPSGEPPKAPTNRFSNNHSSFLQTSSDSRGWRPLAGPAEQRLAKLAGMAGSLSTPKLKTKKGCQLWTVLDAYGRYPSDTIFIVSNFTILSPWSSFGVTLTVPRCWQQRNCTKTAAPFVAPNGTVCSRYEFALMVPW